VGIRAVIAGMGLLIVKVCGFDRPPPGAGLKTVTLAAPAVAISEASIATVNWVLDPKVVTRSTLFQRTTEPEIKPVPLTVRLNAEPPLVADVGLRPVVVGTGLSGLLIVKV
jgi:hypothetical protein